MQIPFNLARHVPDFLRGIREFNVIYNQENTELNNLEILRRQTMLNRFYDEMDEKACARYESKSLLNININADDTLDDRRFRIKSMMCIINHYLIQTLESLCGANNVSVNFRPSEYFIEIKIGLSSKSKFNEAHKLIKRILPCNMFLVFDLLYNTHERLGAYTYAYLSKFTHQGLKENVLGG